MDSPDLVTVREVDDDDRVVVERLGQLERHDLSEFRGYTPGADGLYAFDHLPTFFTDASRHAYLIHYGPALAGFALTRTKDDGATSIVAFFIVRGLRRMGIGDLAAGELLRMRPGRWAIAFQEDNVAAARFWRRVVTRIVGSAWTESRDDDAADTWLTLEVGARKTP